MKALALRLDMTSVVLFPVDMYILVLVSGMEKWWAEDLEEMVHTVIRSVLCLVGTFALGTELELCLAGTCILVLA